MTAYDRTERVPTPRPGARTGGVPVVPKPGGPGSQQRIGPYRLIEEIGEGGMGVVHLALDPRGRAVAIKVLRAHVAHDADARQRLSREVETLSRIRDARVASVIDADVMAPRPYIVTRYVPGPALDEVVEEHGPLAPADLLRLARGIAEAIRAIHACGVVHRDIKPGNVLIEDGDPVLIDFGIAHLQDDVRHTVGGLVMGTPGYLSPELVEGAAITDATDWWGWAATITYAASGRPPFGRARMDAVLTRVRAGDVDLEGVDPRLVPLLRASLSPDPRLRPHADQVIAALELYAAGRAATVPTPSGNPWDDGRAATPGDTQVVQNGSTAVMPPVTPATAHPADTPVRWAPPPTGAPAPAPDPAAYDHGWDDEPASDHEWGGAQDYDALHGHGGEDVEQAQQGYWPEDEWDEEAEPAPREGDPRIGLPMRTGLLAAVGIAWIGALMAWPGIALLVLVVLSALARATDRSVTALVLRRYDFGRRRSDVPFAVVSSPWHLVVGIIATGVGLLLPVAVALAGIFAAALLLAGTQGSDLGPGAPITLAVGGVLGLLMLWWGPGGASLRRGSRSIARRLVPAGLAAQIVSGLLAVFGVVAALVALQHGTSLTWDPFTANPFGH
ncbi:serine/threonine-protein kinase [Terrabacter sp. Soil810]|uniref:serine/threonine-protein kinase n=1 Tax=Terrabacter sp. Soil810 TaxID=1736418 RepID=UPI00070B05CC|nr:serine/threonine-protein kinase [Terrabacter sp. Soil810]KRF40172.1 serine/threonine protein kinase [Terrabacter sp. Soil810]